MTAPHVGNRRLLKLADFIRGLKREELDLEKWITRPGRGGETVPGCGSILCVGGWAAVMPEFNRADLTLIAGWPYYKGLEGIPALGTFFALDSHEARSLFLPSRYPNAGVDATPAFVASRIRALVRKRERVTA